MIPHTQSITWQQLVPVPYCSNAAAESPAFSRVGTLVPPPCLPTAYAGQSVLILHTVNITKADNMGEGEPAPAPAADIKIFISGNSGSKEVRALWQNMGLTGLTTYNCQIQT